MLTIVEGPDGGGKSTLIKKLMREFDGELHHHGAYLGMARIAHKYFASCYEALNGVDVVMDRSWYSEPVYGEAMRDGANRISGWELEALERSAREAGAVIVVCLPPYEDCERAWRSRLEREYPQKAEQLRLIYDLYTRDYHKWRLPIAHYDYTANPDADNVVGWLKELLA